MIVSLVDTIVSGTFIWVSEAVYAAWTTIAKLGLWSERNQLAYLEGLVQRWLTGPQDPLQKAQENIEMPFSQRCSTKLSQ